MTYLRRQFRTIAFIIVPVAALVFVTSTEVLKPLTFEGGSSGPDVRAVRGRSGPRPSSPARSCPGSPASSA